MREISKDEFFIELIEEYPCSTDRELYNREGYWIRHYDAFANGYNALINGRTNKSRCEENKDDINKKRKDKRATNGDEIREYERAQYHNRTEQQKEHYQDYQRQWVKEHRERVNIKCNEWYHKNKETIKNTMYNCECGAVVQTRVKNRHLQTNKHLNTIKNKNIHIENDRIDGE